MDDLNASEERAKGLESELAALKDCPVDVAVEQVDATAEQLAEAEEKGRKEAEEKAKVALDACDASWRKNYDHLKAQLDEAEANLKKVEGVDLLDVKINMVFQRVQELQAEILELADQAEPEKRKLIKGALMRGFRTMLERMEGESNEDES